MKKRLLSLVLCLVMVFSLLPFGASAQVYPITNESVVVEIRFHDTDGTVSTQRVNNVGGSVAEGAIYDPGCTVGENQVFDGWAIGNASATPGSVEAIRSYVNTYFSDYTTSGLDVYAVTSEVRYLTYYDEGGRVLKTVSAKVTGNADPSVTVDQSYVPQSPKMNFAGWTTVESGTVVQYKNDDPITLTSARTKLYPVSKTGYWLSFSGNIEKNDHDSTAATYTAPEFFGEGAPTVAPTPPTRPGYTFKGWYVDAETMQTPYVFGQTLTKNDKVYAKWEATGTVKYQVIFWKQRTTDAPNTADADKTYDYFAEISEERSAAAGSMVKVTDTDKQMARAAEPNIVTGAENWHFFTYNGTRTNENEVPVKGDGTTVLNVYYDRVPVTYKFVDDDGDLYNLVREPEEGETATHYYYNDSYETGYYLIGYGPLAGQTPASLNSAGVQLYDQHTTQNNTNTPTNKYYSSTSGSYTTYLDRYTYSSTTTYNQNNDRYWYYQYSYGRYCFLYAPYTNQSGYYEVGTGPDKTAEGKYVLEPTSFTGLYGAQFTKWPYPGDGQVWQNGAKFPLPLTVFDPETVDEGETNTTQTWTLTSANYSADLIVYKQKTDGSWAYTSDNEIARAKIGYSGNSTWTPTETYSGYTLNAYRFSTSGQWNENVTPSTRLSGYGDHLELRYSRNQYNFNYQSNGRTIAPAAGSKVYYEASLEGFAAFKPTNGPEGTFFDGWYADPGFDTKFDFNSTMPAHDVMVYAKWTPKQYRVVLDLNGGDFNVATQQDTFDLGYLSQINGGNEVGATKADHQLVGWYLPDGTRFNFADTLLTDAIAEEFTADDNPAVRGKVTLTAQWRKILTGEETLKVRYDAKGGTINGEPTSEDSLSYADYAQAIAQAAAAPGTAGQNFSYWQVMQYTENGFVEKKIDGELVKVNPGETFEVRIDDAKPEGNTYYVYLEARYASAGKTHVNWVANNGDGMDYKASENTAINSEIAIESANTFSYPDHVFLGWAKLNEYDATSAPDGMKYDETNGWDQQPALTADDLWLIWDETAGENGAFRVNTGDKPIARAIGADQIKPYEVLYAVWAACPPKTFLIDFNAPMTVATGASVLKDDTHKNGKFEKSAETTPFSVTYQIKPDELLTDGADLSFSGVDSAVVYGVPSNSAAGTTASWNKITTVPASSVYFDDDLRTQDAIAVGDGSGRNAGVSNGSADPLTAGDYTFKFNGSAIDVYGTTDSSGGYIVGTLCSVNPDGSIGDRVASVKNEMMRVQSVTPRNNVPVISISAPAFGTYYLKLKIVGTSNFSLDGIRVYGPINDQTKYDNTTEKNAAYINLRKALLNDSYAAADGNSTVNITTEAVAPGALFVDDVSKLTLQVQDLDQDGNVQYNGDGSVKMKDAWDATVQKYAANSPKNEIYLASSSQSYTNDAGTTVAYANQSLVFSLTATALQGKVWIGLSAPDEDSMGEGKTRQVEVKINGTPHTITVDNQLDQYYEIERAWFTGNNNVVTVTNSGNTMISVTNLKITGVQSIYDAANDSASAYDDNGDPAAIVESFEDVVDLVFEPATIRTLRIAQNNGLDPDVTDVPDDPEPTDEPNPEPTQQPTIGELVRQLISGFVSNLFKSIGRLFGRP